MYLKNNIVQINCVSEIFLCSFNKQKTKQPSKLKIVFLFIRLKFSQQKHTKLTLKPEAMFVSPKLFNIQSTYRQ